MFLLSFALSIAVYTIWLSAKLGILISLGMLGVFIFTTPLITRGLSGIFERKKLAKWYGLAMVWNILALAVVCGNLWWKDGEYLKTFWWIETSPFWRGTEGVRTSPTSRSSDGTQPPSQGGKRQPFNGFGTITDTQKYHVYLFEDEEGKVWRLHSNQTYHIGDQLFLSASVKPLDTNIVFDETFIPPRKAAFREYQFNYDKWIFMKGFDGTAYEKQSLLVDPTYPGMMNGVAPPDKQLWFIDRVRASLQGYVEQVFGQNQYAGLLLGLLIGDKSLIMTEQYDTFVDSGLVHIIAVSGGNIAMVVILLSFLLKWVPLYVRNGLIILMIIFYAAICGGDSSVIRAAIMGCLTLIALFRGREVSIRRAMKYALIGILIFNPFALVYDVGLLLSFSAIVGIVLFQKISEDWARSTAVLRGRFARWQKISRDALLQRPNVGKEKKKFDFFQSKFRKGYMTPTIWASLGTAPVLMFFMNGVNLVGIVLNVIIVPMVPIITIYGFASLFLYAIVQRGGRIRVEVLLMKVVYALSTFGAQYAIFLQAKHVVAKYALAVLFVGLAIRAYVHAMKKKEKTKNLTSEGKPPKPDA